MERSQSKRRYVMPLYLRSLQTRLIIPTPNASLLTIETTKPPSIVELRVIKAIIEWSLRKQTVHILRLGWTSLLIKNETTTYSGILFSSFHSSGSGVSANKPSPCSGGHLSPNTDAFSTKSRICCDSSGVSSTCIAAKFSSMYFLVIVLFLSSATS